MEECKGTIEKAEKGELLIITSAITFIEVIKMKGKEYLKREAEKDIRAFFDNSFISVRNVDREIDIITGYYLPIIKKKLMTKESF